MENNTQIVSREDFIRNTYMHVAGAIAIFAALEAWVIKSGLAMKIAGLLSMSQYAWLIVLALFMGVSWIAQKWARSDTSREIQYLGLGFYIVAEALIFSVLILQAAPQMIQSAGLVTGFLVLGITVTAFVTKKDFGFLGKYLMVGGFVAMGIIAAGVIFGWNLGVWFSGAMALFAGVSVLHSTSNIIHHYNPRQHVAAALDLFASIALMFWYILQLLMGSNNN